MHIVTSMLNKIFEKCPLGSVIVRSCPLFIPSPVTKSTFESNKKLSKLLNHMSNRKMISPGESDKLLSQLSDFIYEDVSTNRDTLTSFNKENGRLDIFYFSTVNIGEYK